jgi:hypothetical protein
MHGIPTIVIMKMMVPHCWGIGWVIDKIVSCLLVNARDNRKERLLFLDITMDLPPE